MEMRASAWHNSRRTLCCRFAAGTFLMVVLAEGGRRDKPKPSPLTRAASAFDLAEPPPSGPTPETCAMQETLLEVQDSQFCAAVLDCFVDLAYVVVVL